MAVRLFDYQIDAISRLKSGSILKSVVGSGKSITALGFYLTEVCGGAFTETGKIELDREVSPVDLFIITTAKKRDSKEWEKECSKYGWSTDTSCSLGGTKVVIDSWNNVHKYEGEKNAFFIFDEQRVVGSGSWVSSFIKIAKNNKWILLTATPGDTWMDYIPVFIANGYYKNRTDFIRQHVVYSPFTNFPKVQKYINEEKLLRLRKEITVEMDNVKQDRQNHITVKCDYDKYLEHETVKNRWNYYDDNPIATGSEFCFLLRKIANSADSRLQNLLYIAEKHKKIIVFYNFNYELEAIKERLTESGIPFAEWNGKKHENIPEDKDSWVYLVQYFAGAEGWECILTNVIVFFSPNYSYKIMIQAAGRIDRLNTPFDELLYYHLLSDSLADKAINKANKEKKMFNEKEFGELALAQNVTLL